MKYFNFSEEEDKVYIPVRKSSKPKKWRSSFVDHNKISQIKSKSLEKYIASCEAKKNEDKK